MGLCKLLLVFLYSAVVNASVKWKPNMESFTHSVKEGGCEENREVSLFEFTDGPGVITEQWFTGNGCINQDTVIRYYIDDEVTPSIEVNLYMAHGIGYVDELGPRFGNKGKSRSSNDYSGDNANDIRDFDKISDLGDRLDDSSGLNDNDVDRSEYDSDDRGDNDPAIPWGTRHMGHVGRQGGLYNTFKIPFKQFVYVSMISKHNGSYWYTVRGVQNYPLIIGDLELPQSAMLKLHKNEDVTVEPFDLVSLATSTNKTGLLFQITLNTESENLYHQEACFRIKSGDDRKTQYLSSGTEDLFLSSFYYSGGIFHTEQSGLSYIDRLGRMCAYKFFEDDPVLFSRSFSLKWRCGELADNKCFKVRQRACKRKYGNKHCVTERDREVIARYNDLKMMHTRPTVVNSYVWTYEW